MSLFGRSSAEVARGHGSQSNPTPSALVHAAARSHGRVFSEVLDELSLATLDSPETPVEVSRILTEHDWLRISRLPRTEDVDGRPVQHRHRERLFLTALSELRVPVGWRLEQRDGQLSVEMGVEGSNTDTIVLRQALECHFPGCELSAAVVVPLIEGNAAHFICGTPQELPPQLDVDYPDLGALVSAFRGRDFGLVIRALPVSRGDVAAQAARLSANIRDWSADLQESADTSFQHSPTASRTIRREHSNRAAQLAIEWSEVLLQRTTKGMAEGAWRWFGWIWAADSADAAMATALFRGLFGGPDSLPEPLRARSMNTAACHRDIRDGRVVCRSGSERTELGALLPSSHLAALMRFPQESFPGFTTPASAPFSMASNHHADPAITIGTVLDRGMSTGAAFRIGLGELASHTLVAGMTGAGKTNACMALLRSADEQGVPFLVIEPAKTEYRSLLRTPQFEKRLRVFTLGDECTSPFRLNPFWCPEGYSVSTHLDYLKSVFSSSFAMYGPMPHILEAALVRVYERRGWDLAKGVNRFAGPREDRAVLFPTLHDLYDEIDPVVRAIGYAEELTMDVRGAMKTRIKSLLTGAKGLMLASMRSTPIDDLLSVPTVLELSALGDDQEKSLLMGLVLLSIYERRQVGGTDAKGLIHLTLIEEAHRILKNVPQSNNPEVANVAGKAVEMFNDILSEIRAYGEGLIIAEQIPSKLSPDAIKNSGFKLVHRLHAADDRTSMGDAMVLTVPQKTQLARLPNLVAAAFGAGVQEAVLVRIAGKKPQFEPGATTPSTAEIATLMGPYHFSASAVRERFPACAMCLTKCERTIEAAEMLEEPDSRAYREFCALVLKWTLVEPWQGATEDSARRSDQPFCESAHMAHRFVRERARFYRLSVVDEARLERLLVAAMSVTPHQVEARHAFVHDWHSVLERTLPEQRSICGDCRLPLCIGHETAAALSDPRAARALSEARNPGETAACLNRMADRIAGRPDELLRPYLSYCYFVRRSAEIELRGASSRYDELMKEAAAQ